MEPTQEQLDSYAATLCQLKEIKDFLNSIKCNPDGSYIETNNNCCFDTTKINLEDLVTLISVTLNQEISDTINNISQNDLEPADLQPLIDASECICQKTQEIIDNLTPAAQQLAVTLPEIESTMDSVLANLDDIDTNTEPLAQLLPLLDDIITELQTPDVVDVVPYTEFFIGTGAGQQYLFSIPEFLEGVDFTQNQAQVYGNSAIYVGKLFDAPATTELGQVYVDFPTPPLRTGVGGCNQSLIQVMSDGTFTDENNTPITISNDMEQKIGYCRTGLLPTAWNTPYTIV